jgi:hypothetical protein
MTVLRVLFAMKVIITWPLTGNPHEIVVAAGVNMPHVTCLYQTLPEGV